MSVSGNPGTSVLFHRLGIWRCDRLVGKQLAFGLISRVEFSLVDEEEGLGNPRVGVGHGRMLESRSLTCFVPSTPPVLNTCPCHLTECPCASKSASKKLEIRCSEVVIWIVSILLLNGINLSSMCCEPNVPDCRAKY
jgi:hypothetical protein